MDGGSSPLLELLVHVDVIIVFIKYKSCNVLDSNNYKDYINSWKVQNTIGSFHNSHFDVIVG